MIKDVFLKKCNTVLWSSIVLFINTSTIVSFGFQGKIVKKRPKENRFDFRPSRINYG